MFRVLLINLKEASQSLGFDSYRLADGLLFNALLILKIRSKIETASSLTTKSTIFSLQRAYFPCQSGINWDILILFRSSQVTCGKTCPFYYESRFLFVYESRYKNSVSLSRSVVEDLRFNCIGWQNFFKTYYVYMLHRYSSALLIGWQTYATWLSELISLLSVQSRAKRRLLWAERSCSTFPNS